MKTNLHGILYRHQGKTYLKPQNWRYDFTCTDLRTINTTIIAYQQWSQLSPEQQNQARALAFMPEDNLSDPAENLKTALQHNAFELLAAVFPSFHEGRGFTQAQQLRNQYGYTGELRAINAYRDNLQLLEQCGFDSFDLTPAEDPRSAQNAFSELNLTTVA